MIDPAPHRFALAAALFLLATGGWLGTIENGILTDTFPAAAAAAVLLLGLTSLATSSAAPAASPRTAAIAPADVGLVALVVLALLALRGPEPDYRTALHTAVAAVAYLAGRSMRLDALHRRALVAATLIPLGYAAWQRWFLFPQLAPLLSGEAQSRILSGRVFSVFILPGQFSAWIAVVLPLVIAVALIGPWRHLARAATGALLVAFALAGSLAGPFCALPTLAWFLGRGRLASVLLILVLATIAASVATRPEVQRLWSEGSPVALRVATWAATFQGIMDAPGLGHGSGSFDALYRQRYWQPGADEVRHPHNWPLLLWFEHGIVGLAAWLALASRLFTPVRDRSARAAAAAFLLATLLDVADLSGTLRALGMLYLGASTVIGARHDEVTDRNSPGGR